MPSLKNVVVAATLGFSPFLVNADISYTIKIVEGTSHSNCDTLSSDDAAWGAKVDGFDYVIMHGSGYDCPDRVPPQTLMAQTFDCSAQKSTFRLCLVAGDDDRFNPTCSGFGDDLEEDELGCKVSGCTTSQAMAECWSADCGLTQRVSYGISGGKGVSTDGAVFEITRSGSCITQSPSKFPTNFPTLTPTTFPTQFPSPAPTLSPSRAPTRAPVPPVPTQSPSLSPTFFPTTPEPTLRPTRSPTLFPSEAPSVGPTHFPTTGTPTKNPTKNPTKFPTRTPTKFGETFAPTTAKPTSSPSISPTTAQPTGAPTTKAPTYACAGALGTCGGKEDYVGPSCCVEGYECTEISSSSSVCTLSQVGSNDPDESKDSPMGAILAGLIGVVLLLVVILAVVMQKRRKERRKKVMEGATKKLGFAEQNDMYNSKFSSTKPPEEDIPKPEEFRSSRGSFEQPKEAEEISPFIGGEWQRMSL